MRRAALVAIAQAALLSACGGSTAVETVVGPNSVRCQTTLSGPSVPVEPDGATIDVRVGAARDCTWTATSEASWMQLNATSGQGDATIAVTVGRNEAAASRSGAVVVNDQRVTISQQARPCTFEIRADPQSFPSTGGRGTIAVTTLTGCSWTANGSAEWIRVLTASGSGSGSIAFEVTGNSGERREASISVGGQSVTINQDGRDQSPGGPVCTLTAAPPVVTASAAGGTQAVTITVAAGCDWRAMSSASWLTVAPASGRGPGTVTITVERNTGSARSATLSVGGQVVTVNQAAAPACTFTIEPSSANFGASGGDGSVRVSTQEGCDWSVSGGASWTQVTNGRGNGSGEARYTVAANTGTSARSTTLTVAGRAHTVTQQAAAPTCTYSLQPGSTTVGAAGGSGQFTVNTQANCAWTASSGAGWISTSSSGSGSGTVSFSVQAHTGTAPRQGTITVAGQSFSITQEAAAPTCTYTLQPTSQNVGASGGGGSFAVTTQDGCAWTASAGAGWITTSSSGSGSGTVNFSVQANTSTSPRQGTISVGGQSFGVTQDAAAPTCTYTLQPTSQNFGSPGGSGQFSVTTQAGCAWTAASGAGWVTTSSSGSGAGTVSFSVQANSTTTARQTTITVGGQSFSVSQDAAAPVCTYTLQPTSQGFGAAGGNGQFTVTTQSGCAWSASSGAGWVTTSSSGSGTGSVSFTVQANTGPSRQTTISVGGQSFAVTQDAAAIQACTFSISPGSRDFGPSGGDGTVQVTTASNCAWSSSSSVAWITFLTGSGSGPGAATYRVAANASDDEREATLTVAGQSHRVEQEEGDDDDDDEL